MILHYILISLIIGIPIPLFKFSSYCLNEDFEFFFILSFMATICSVVLSVAMIACMIIKSFIIFPLCIFLIITASIGMVVARYTVKDVAEYLKDDCNLNGIPIIYALYIILTIFSPFICVVMYIFNFIFINNSFYKIYNNVFTGDDE